MWCVMRKRKPMPKKQRNFVIEKRTAEHDEDEIEAEIARQLEARRNSPERQTYSNQAQNVSPGSSKKVVKKRIVKMMKDGELVAEKEEILDEEGNVLKTQMRREGSGSPV